MTAEGVFPKIGGDVIYASEVNRFAGAGRFCGIGSFVIEASGAAYQLGSVVIGAGNLTNPCGLTIDWYPEYQTRAIKLEVSGASGNGAITHTHPTDSNLQAMVCSAQLGSPYIGYLHGFSTFSHDKAELYNYTTNFGGISIAQLDTTKDVCIKFYMITKSANSGFYNVQSYRSSV